MQRLCDFCSLPYTAKSTRSRFCSGRCRKRHSRSPFASADIVDLTTRSKPGELVATLRAELAAADRLGTVAGQQALELAARIESPAETGSAVASLSKELRVLLAEVAKPLAREWTPLDELRARRARKLGGR